jgi:NAD(P)-dependent dehydrogenase (short-subunit alcohol dehydrogenase family)
MENFRDKVVVITGGNSGICYATAKEFKAQGATVVITGKREVFTSGELFIDGGMSL